MAEYSLIGESIEKLEINLQSLKGALGEEEYEEVSEKIEKIKEDGLNLPSRSPIETVEILRKIVDLEMDIFPKETMTDVAKKVKLDALLEKLKYILGCTQRGIDTSEILRTAEEYWETIEDNYDDVVQRKISNGIDELKLEATLTKIKSFGTIDMNEVRLDQNYYLIRKKLQEVMEKDTISEEDKQLISSWLGESIDIKTGGIDEKAMEKLMKNPDLWRTLAGIKKQQVNNKEEYILDKSDEARVETELRRREIKEVCERYGIDESEVRGILDYSPNNVYIVKKFLGGYEVVASRVDSGHPKAKAIIYNNERLELSEALNGCYPEIVVLSSNLRAIPPKMFYKNKNLTSIRLPKNLKKIGHRAFGKSGIESIEIPDSVEDIGEYAFSDSCLEELKLGRGVRNIEWGTFQKCKLKTLDIPGSVSKIAGREKLYDGEGGYYTEYGAFENNPLREVKFNYGTSDIGEFSFYKTKLESIMLPPSVKDVKKQIANSRTIVKMGVLASPTSNRETQVSKPLQTVNVDAKDSKKEQQIDVRAMEELKNEKLRLAKRMQEIEEQLKGIEETKDIGIEK